MEHQPMTAYAPSDVRSITVPHGCGQPHEAGDLAPGERFAFNCEQCEPHVLGLAGHGWATSPMHVGLTCDEKAEAEALERQAAASRDKTWSDPKAFAAFMASAGYGQPGGHPADIPQVLLETIGAMKRQIEDLTARLAEHD